jgi:hypothetical protein
MRFGEVKEKQELFDQKHGNIKVIRILKDSDFLGRVSIDLTFENQYGVTYRRSGGEEEETGFTDPNLPVVLMGKHKGRCECGSWTIASMANCHDEGCPEYRHNGMESSLKEKK